MGSYSSGLAHRSWLVAPAGLKLHQKPEVKFGNRLLVLVSWKLQDLKGSWRTSEACYCEKPGEAFGEAVASVGVENVGLNGSCRKAEDWHHGVSERPEGHHWKYSLHCSGAPSILQILGPMWQSWWTGLWGVDWHQSVRQAICAVYSRVRGVRGYPNHLEPGALSLSPTHWTLMLEFGFALIWL